MKKAKNINKSDDYLPEIKVKPNLGKDKTNQIPNIIFDGKRQFTNSDRLKLVQLLCFINSADLIGLKNIRIVPELKSVYRGEADGCYFAKNRNNEAEIVLREDLFSIKNRIINIFLKIFSRNNLLEVLYHEVGHHKAAITHSISKYKGEAFAEKYMRAYKEAWFNEYKPKKFVLVVFKLTLRPIIFSIKWISYLFRNKYPTANLVYKYFNKEITKEEYSAEAQLIANAKEKKSTSKKIHPLKDAKYRKKFKIKKIY